MSLPRLGRILDPGQHVSFDEKAISLMGWRFGSIYRQFRSMSGRFCLMNRQIQLTCLCCVLKIHHNNENQETKGTLSLWRNHYGSHFLPFLTWRNHFWRGNFYVMTGPPLCTPMALHTPMYVGPTCKLSSSLLAARSTVSSTRHFSSVNVSSAFPLTFRTIRVRWNSKERREGDTVAQTHHTQTGKQDGGIRTYACKDYSPHRVPSGCRRFVKYLCTDTASSAPPTTVLYLEMSSRGKGLTEVPNNRGGVGGGGGGGKTLIKVGYTMSSKIPKGGGGGQEIL